MVGGDSVGGECAVSVGLLWNRLSGFISPSHLYLRRNVASGLKPISITCLHFINFRTITRELPFDTCSSSLSCTSKRSLWEQGCEASLICVPFNRQERHLHPLQACASVSCVSPVQMIGHLDEPTCTGIQASNPKSRSPRGSGSKVQTSLNLLSILTNSWILSEAVKK